MSLHYVGQQLTIYFGLILFIAGVFGNGMNIFIFSRVDVYRTIPSTFYFLFNSISSGIYVIIIITTRILSVGYGLDFTSNSIVWCKMRQFLISTLSLISLSCSCLAIMDQFLATSKSLIFRQYSNIKLAHRIIFLIIIIWCLHGIPFFFYFNISLANKTCICMNYIYRDYLVVYTLILLYVIPVLIVIVFGYLTYRNIHQLIHRPEQQVDRQLTIMTLIQVILIVISVIPPGIYSAYMTITIGLEKDTDRRTKETFAAVIISLTSSFYHVGTFYMFLISSSRFRGIVKNQILGWCRTNNILV